MITRMLPEFEKHGGSLKKVSRDTVQSALEHANVVGGLTCTKSGTIPVLPMAKEVDKFIKSCRQKHECSTPHGALMHTEAPKKLARVIDHTMLKPYCIKVKDIEKLCQEAHVHGFAMFAVDPAQVERYCGLLQGTSVRVGAAIGFPLGQTTLAVKAFKTRDSIQCGVLPKLMMNIRELQSGNYDLIHAKIEAACRSDMS